MRRTRSRLGLGLGGYSFHVDTSEEEPPRDPAGPLHVSTGRLSASQAARVQEWRRVLRRGYRASTSDCIAAAVHALLAAVPDPLDVARAAESGRRAAVGRQLGGPAVSVYVGAEDAEEFLALIDRAGAAVVELAEQLRLEASAAGQDSVALRVREALESRGLPRPGRAIPRGAVARLAIDGWTARPARDVAADAARWAAVHHEQLHLARRDMRDLR